MGLRSTIYLDVEHLISQAEYHDIEVPRTEEIVETNRRQRRAGGKLGMPGTGVDAGAGSEIETQSTYRLEPQQRATVSKVIDRLHAEGVVKTKDDLADTAVQVDDLVELHGTVRMTATTVAGKVFHLARAAITAQGGDISQLDDLRFEDPKVQKVIRDIYLENQLLPIPMLLEVIETGLPVKPHVNFNASHFTDPGAADRIEGERRVLGTVRTLVDGDDEGYLSAEEWLLPGWEYTMRRLMLAGLEDKDIRKLLESVGLDMPQGSAGTHIQGPAFVIDAIALY